MDQYVGEIRIFTGNYAPTGWAFCNGALLDIGSYQTLFSLVSTTYGGDGVSNFAVPDLRGRTPIGTGSGAGLTAYPNPGTPAGTESVTLAAANLPASHTHVATITVDATTPSATATLNAAAGTIVGGGTQPGGAILGNDTSGNSSPFADVLPSRAVSALAPASIAVSGLKGPAPTFNIGSVGGSTPHNNMQPFQVVNYIICTEGIYPSRP